MKFGNRWIKLFLRRNNLNMRKLTHKDNLTIPGEIKAKIDTFLGNIKVLRDRFKYSEDYIINMDETPCFFDYCLKTVNKVGSKFIHQIKLGADKRRATCVLSVTVSGKVLPTFLIYN